MKFTIFSFGRSLSLCTAFVLFLPLVGCHFSFTAPAPTKPSSTSGMDISISAVSPSSGPASGGTSVTINGTGFDSQATVTLGGGSCTSLSVLSSTQITCTSPAHAAGSVEVIVANSDGRYGTGTNSFTYIAAPSVSAVVPTAGALAGGITLTITGAGFSSGAQVKVDGTHCTGVSVDSSTQIRCTNPAHSAGTVDLTVTNSDNQSGTGAGLYTYQPAPSVTGVTPTAGALAGGTVLTLTGTGFLSGADVKIGGTDCTAISVDSPTQITCTSPNHSAGTVNIVVTNSDTQGGTGTGLYTYQAAPTVSSLTPNTDTTAGGTSITIAGTGFVSGATVTLGGSSCTGAIVNSSTQITCMSPPHSAGVVDAVVTNSDTQSGTKTNGFTFTSTAVQLTNITPNTGITAGGIVVTLAGTSFVNGATVTIGGVGCTSVIFVSSTQLECLTPAHAAGAVDVVVTNPDTSTSTLTNGFTYGLNSLNVERVYDNHNSINSWTWNYYVDASITTSDCSAGSATSCSHAGEKRKVITDEVTCTNRTMSDNLGIFSWSCALSGGLAVFTTNGFNSGKGLADLVDATAWKNNYVTLNANGTPYTSATAAWWTNTVQALPVATTVQTLSTAGTIYTLAASGVANGYWLAADRIAVVTLSGATLTYGDSASNNCSNSGGTTGPNNRCLISVGKGSDSSRNFTWVEGTFSGNAATNKSNYGIFLSTAKFSRVHNTASSYSSYGVHLSNSLYNNLSKITNSNNTSYGVSFSSSNSNTLSELTSSSNNRGLNISNSSGNTFSQISCSNNTSQGIYLSSSSNNTLSDIATTGNTTGVYFSEASNNILSRVRSSKDTSTGVSFAVSSNNNSLSQITLSNIMGYGLRFNASSYNTVTQLISTSNNSSGAVLENASIRNSIFQSTMNNNGYGILLSEASDYTVLLQTAVTNATFHGVYLGTTSSNDTLSNIVSTNNGGYGVYIRAGSDNSTFGQRLFVGNNTSGNCSILGTGNNISNDGSNNCTTSDGTLTITAGVTQASTYRGLAVAGDSGNIQGAAIDAGNGVLAFASITDWLNFENIFRGWGKYANVTPTHSGNRLNCSSGNCGLWDWSLVTGDTALKAKMACPGSEDFGTHTWSDASTTKYLLNATEVLSDSLGNDNGLCEGNEICIFTPNIGAYQGHGTLAASAGISGCADIGVGGTMQNITLQEYPTNGY